ncbi:MAG: GIN domain-containing protein [Alphaproteobacteria bacterium]
MWVKGKCIAAALIIGALAAGSQAAADTPGGLRSFEAAALVIDDLIGTLKVEVVESGPMTVLLEGPDAKVRDIAVRVEGDALVIKRGMGPTGTGPFRAEDYAVVTVEVPANTPLTIDDMDGIAIIGDLDAPVTIYVASLDITLGNVRSAMIDRFGSGNVTIGDVAGEVSAKLSGSGDIVVGSAETARIEKRGSGNVVLGPVRGSLVAEMRGSGDVVVESAGTVDLTKRGSGDVDLGRIAGALSYRSAGIGDVDIASVDGPVAVSTTSSGKIHIHSGTARPLEVEIAEYGDFTLDGNAVDPKLTVSGASIIKLQSYTGEFEATGSGDIRVGGHRVYPL